ncbi:MAG: universal stress protein [Chitinophagaceae bacterium]|nr:MAG: universal stress protein [Chitinophagaceae bacterium]
MKKIIIATDFSPAAENAMRYAADMALHVKADLVLFHVCQMPPNYAEAPVTSLVSLEDDAWESLENRRMQLSDRMAGDGNIECFVKSGNFLRELRNLCELHSPHLVVVGSRGTSTLERFFFGDHSGKAVEKIEWPVLAIPLGHTYQDVKKICLACDMENVRETVPVDSIRELVNQFDGKLHILNTGRFGEYHPDLVVEAGILESMFKKENPVFHFTAGDNTDRGILDFVSKNAIDLLLVIPKSRGVFKRILTHHHTRFLVLHCPVPVLGFHK